MGGVRDAPRTATSGRSPRPPRLPATALEAPPPSRTGRPPPLRSRHRRTAGPSSRSASTRRLPPSSPVRACASFAHLAGPCQQRRQVDRSLRFPVLVQDHVVLLALPEHGGGIAPEPGIVQVGAEHPGTHPLLVRLVPVDGHAKVVGDPDQLITRPDPADVAQVVHLFLSVANRELKSQAVDGDRIQLPGPDVVQLPTQLRHLLPVGGHDAVGSAQVVGPPPQFLHHHVPQQLPRLGVHRAPVLELVVLLLVVGQPLLPALRVGPVSDHAHLAHCSPLIAQQSTRDAVPGPHPMLTAESALLLICHLGAHSPYPLNRTSSPSSTPAAANITPATAITYITCSRSWCRSKRAGREPCPGRRSTGWSSPALRPPGWAARSRTRPRPAVRSAPRSRTRGCRRSTRRWRTSMPPPAGTSRHSRSAGRACCARSRSSPRSPEPSGHVDVGALAQEFVGEPARAERLLLVRALEDVARIPVPAGGAVAVEVGPGPAEPLHDLAAHGGRDLASDARGLALAEGARAPALQPDGVGVGVGAVGHLRDLPEFSTAAPVVGADAQSHPLDQGL